MYFARFRVKVFYMGKDIRKTSRKADYGKKKRKIVFRSTVSGQLWCSFSISKKKKFNNFKQQNY